MSGNALPITLAGQIEQSLEVVCAYISHNPVSPTDLPKLIQDVHNAVVALAAPVPAAAEPEVLLPAVPIRRSVTPDAIICLDDGLRFKSLKRHLTTLGMTPDGYRAKWGLPADYPMVAPNYSTRRSDLAKANGLGTHHGRAN